jgi:hypothetical protein
MWELHQRELQQLEQQRAQVKAQLVQASGGLQLQRLCFFVTLSSQFNDAQRQKDVDRLRPGLQLDARWATQPLSLPPPPHTLPSTLHDLPAPTPLPSHNSFFAATLL